jgi:hypothetical protein
MKLWSAIVLVLLFAPGCSSCSDPVYSQMRALQAQLSRDLPEGTPAKRVEEYLAQHHIGYEYQDPVTIKAANYDAVNDVVGIPGLFSYHRRDGIVIVFSFDNQKRLTKMVIEPIFFWL